MSISFLQVENTIKAISVKSKQIHPHIRTIVKDQHVADKMLKLLHEDFIQQTVENMSTKYF